MTDQRSISLDRALADWLRSAPDDNPPDGLLARAIDEVAVTQQRPGIVARAFGAPAGAAPGSRVVLGPAWVWLLIAIGALVAVGVAGGILEPRRPIVPVPVVDPSAEDSSLGPRRSPTPSPTASTTPRPSAAGTPRPSAEVPRLGSDRVTYEDLGFSALPFADGKATRLGHVVQFAGPKGVGLGLGSPEVTVPTALVEFRVESVSDGVTLDLAPAAGPIRGATLSEFVTRIEDLEGVSVARSQAAALDGESATRLVLAATSGERATIVLAVHNDRVYMLIGRYLDFSGILDRDAADLAVLLPSVDAFRFLDSHRIETPSFIVVYPDNWGPTSGVVRGGRVQLGTGNLSGIKTDTVGIEWAEPGETITLDLGQQAGLAQLSGHDLASLLASAKSAFPEAATTRIKIGGEPAWRIGVQQESYVFPLAGLAITWHDGQAYVFYEHYLFDAAGPGGLGAILAGVTFR